MYDSIRTATAADAADFAYVLCESWKAAYRDILTPERLADQTDLARRTAFFERLLPDPGCFLARDGGNPCGICSVSPERSGELPGWGEVVSLYTLPAYWGSGLGRALMDRALDALAAAGYANVCLWAFEANGAPAASMRNAASHGTAHASTAALPTCRKSALCGKTFWHKAAFPRAPAAHGT